LKIVIGFTILCITARLVNEIHTIFLKILFSDMKQSLDKYWQKSNEMFFIISFFSNEKHFVI